MCNVKSWDADFIWKPKLQTDAVSNVKKRSKNERIKRGPGSWKKSSGDSLSESDQESHNFGKTAPGSTKQEEDTSERIRTKKLKKLKAKLASASSKTEYGQMQKEQALKLISDFQTTFHQKMD